MANQEHSDLLKGQQGESGPDNRSIPPWKIKNCGAQAVPDPLKHFLGAAGRSSSSVLNVATSGKAGRLLRHESILRELPAQNEMKRG